MDRHTIERLNDVRPSVYRAAMKLQALQKLCHMDMVSVCHIMATPPSVFGAQQQDLDGDAVLRTLNQMFVSVGHVTPEEAIRVMLQLFEWCGRVSAAALQTALIALCADSLMAKYRALLRISANSSGSISRSGLRSLLQDLSQVPAAVQEESVFGSVEAAVMSCFTGVSTPTISEEQALSWLLSEPCLLLWLPTLYRLSVSQNVRHAVRCHTCKTVPITGLRYRCMKCVNVHLCQSCYLSEQHTRKHKTHHPVIEFCTQPSWKESLSSLVHNACYALLPRRHTQRKADRKRVLMWAEPGKSQNSGPPPSDASTHLVDSLVRHSSQCNRNASHDASGHLCSASTKALQTDEETQQTDPIELLTEVRNLHRDKWLLEQELQAWRLAVQSEHGVLEDRCSEMEVTMETLKQHHLRLQGLLTQAFSKMEDQEHANNTPHGMDHLEHTNNTPHGVDHLEHTNNMPHGMEDDEHANNTPHGMEDEEHANNTPHGVDHLEHTNNTPHGMEDEEHANNTPHGVDHLEHANNMPHGVVDEEHANNTPHAVEDEEHDNTPHGEDMGHVERKHITTCSDNDEDQPPAPKIHLDTPPSHDLHCEKTAGSMCLCHPIGQENRPKEVELQGGDTRLSEEEEDDCGTWSPEELLVLTVGRLKTVMEKERWRERQTVESREVELLSAADQVGESIHHLVDAVRTKSLTR